MSPSLRPSITIQLLNHIILSVQELFSTTDSKLSTVFFTFVVFLLLVGISSQSVSATVFGEYKGFFLFKCVCDHFIKTHLNRKLDVLSLRHNSVVLELLL